MISAKAPENLFESWQDFIYHIAYIALGLLVAIALDEMVVYIHHRIDVAETRVALQKEREINIRHFTIQSEEIDRVVPILKKDLQILDFLHHHPGAPKSLWPGEFHWGGLYPEYDDTAWQTAQTGQIFERMPATEVRRLNFLYAKLHDLNQMSGDAIKIKYRLYSTMLNDSDASKMTPTEIDKQIELTTELLEACAYTSRAQHNILRFNADFAPGPHYTPTTIFENLIITPDEKSVLADERRRLFEKDDLDNRAADHP